MKSVLATLAAIAATVVSAQYNVVSITSPLTGTVYTAGQNASITWINPSTDVIPQIVLAKGDPTALQYVTTIAQNVSTAGGVYIWPVPADTPAANNYALMLGTSPNISYTGLFTIQSGNSA
ncbi:uncharacterized protein B0P05DRAFT_521746 [Gilbertella persicaria]|uniref:uncharacterized protein n=1 Tax=Gilbertella persicaria TaxID=101096 RepID=UPI00221EBFBE|nr:uncharacterized protein B0P05DRAFT_521746 [Gilbertella persicaria]KAI8098387.1 hypothetical protein B0P05DRAFT_521746 [Gilbertella persicaria]